MKINGNCCLCIFSEVKQNGVSEEDAVRDPSIFRETREKEEVYILMIHGQTTLTSPISLNKKSRISKKREINIPLIEVKFWEVN